MSSPPRLTLFGVGDVEYAVTGRVPRSLPARWPLPERVEHAGAEFPVIDLPALLATGGKAVGTGADGALLLLVEQGAGDGRTVRRALVVERLTGTERFDPASIEPVPEVYPETDRQRWRGLIPRPDGRVAVLLELDRLDGPDGRGGS